MGELHVLNLHPLHLDAPGVCGLVQAGLEMEKTWNVTLRRPMLLNLGFGTTPIRFRNELTVQKNRKIDRFRPRHYTT